MKLVIKCPYCQKEVNYDTSSCFNNCSICCKDIDAKLKRMSSEDLYQEALSFKTNDQLYFSYLTLSCMKTDKSDKALYELGMIYYKNRFLFVNNLDENSRKSKYEICFTKSAKFKHCLSEKLLLELGENNELILKESIDFYNALKENRLIQDIEGLINNLNLEMDYLSLKKEVAQIENKFCLINNNSLSLIKNYSKFKEAKEIIDSKEKLLIQEKKERTIKNNNALREAILEIDINNPVDYINNQLLNINKFIEECGCELEIESIKEHKMIEEIKEELDKKSLIIAEKEEKQKAEKNMLVLSFLDELKKNENGVIYHESLGEGIILYVDDCSAEEGQCFIKFPNNNIKQFKVFDAYESGSLNLKNIWGEKPIEEQTYKDKQLILERKYFEDVEEACSYNLSNMGESESIGVTNYDLYDETYDPQLISNNNYKNEKKILWNRISMNPYFASIKNKRGENFVIGQHSIIDKNKKELVIDWRNQKADSYYQFINLGYTGENNSELSLVRTHHIDHKVYKDFNDYYNLENEENNNDGYILSSISDKFLVRLVEEARNRKEPHDIIRSIEKKQYEIIKNNKDGNMLVTGCAGCGKTMILFHRISYLAYNKQKNKNLSNCIITAGKIINDESTKLSEILNINNSIIIYKTDFYKKTLQGILDLYNYQYIIPNFKSLKSNPSYYSKDFLMLLKDELDNTEYYIYYRLSLFFEVYDKIFNIKTSELNRNFDVFAEYINSEQYLKYYAELEKILSEISVDELKENQYLSFYEDDLELIIKFLGPFMKKNSKMVKNGAITKVTSKNTYITELRHLLNKNDEIVYSNLLNFSAKKSFVDACEIMNLKKQFSSLKDFVSNKPNVEIPYLCEYCIRKHSDFQNISNYDFIFLMLYLMGKKGHQSMHGYDVILIDEFQNYSPEELEILSLIYKKTSFCLFGDLKQRIDEKGINSLKELPFDFKDNIYDLNINYRNTKEICEYLNKTFNLSMVSIGIHGDPVIIARKNYEVILDGDDDRIAIIGKNLEKIDFIKVNKNNLNIISSNNLTIIKGKLNFISVEHVKGLEFEKVIVISDELTENELYLACSRALNKLVVIK